MPEISFLHLSDLHIGDKLQKGLISQTKKILFEDIAYILSKFKSLDIVFFTGDFVQKGSSVEFGLLEEFLTELWQLFSTLGYSPYLICVPGNHDLERIDDPNNPTQKILSSWTSENIKEEYFWNAPNTYHDFIKERFNNYNNWYNNTSIKKPNNIVNGFLPGDYYTSISIKGVSLGIVGLNSSFLQLFNGDYLQKLGIYNKQINYLFKEGFFEWLKQQDLSVLLTHHSPQWYEHSSNKDYHQEIYCSDTFIEHLCGHMHKTVYENTALNGYPTKRVFIAPSLFGLEYYEDKTSVSRTHGYTAGIYNVESGRISKTLFPRISFRTDNGNLKISANENFNLDKETNSFSEILVDKRNLYYDTTKFEDNKNFIAIDEKTENLFSPQRISTHSLSKTIYKKFNSHQKIRFQERKLAIEHFTSQNYCWIVTKFGYGEDEFLGSILSDININPDNCFCINCDEVKNTDDLTEVFNKTFSLNVTKFFDIINSLEKPLLVFDNIGDELIKNSEILSVFIQTIFDFCTHLKIAFISDIAPNNVFFKHVELLTLDTPAVKQYIEHSQESHSTFTFLEYEKIFRISSGIPVFIDKVIEQLKFRPLSDLSELEFDSTSYDDTDNILSKAVKNEIRSLMMDESKQGGRRFSLLSVISLLHNGETFERIKRYDPTKPFHPDDITFLLKSKLIEAVQVNAIFNDNNKDCELIKILKAPRLIRDYVTSLLSEEEKVEIYKQACSLYLGNEWRNYSIKLVQLQETELNLIVYQNLQIALRFILSMGIENNNTLEINRMSSISLTLVSHIKGRGAYKDAIALAEETIRLIKDVDYIEINNTRLHLLIKLGECLRMTRFYDKSIEILKAICNDFNNTLSKKERNDIRLNISYAYEKLQFKEEAIYYANLIKKNESDKNSSMYLSAESVIVAFIEDKEVRIKKLTSIKNKAEKFNHNSLKANMILDICNSDKSISQIKQLDKVILESKDDTYNKVRALVVKADIILNTKQIDEISYDDLLGLNISYSYSFHQRLLALLNKCHKLAWNYWLNLNRFDQLVNLFRYSSFVWRLCGEIEQEQKYLDLLHSNKEFLQWFRLNKESTNCVYFEQRIFSSYNSSNL